MINVEWTGTYPVLCAGEWILIIDNVDYSYLIPFQHDNANTYKVYETWNFTEDYSDVEWETYEDGLHEDEWIKANADWLAQLPHDVDYKVVYKCFQEEDWRHGSCGGCI